MRHSTPDRVAVLAVYKRIPSGLDLQGKSGVFDQLKTDHILQVVLAIKTISIWQS